MLSDLETFPEVHYGDSTVKLDFEDPPEYLQEVARKELRESTELQKEAVIALRNLLAADTDLVTPLENDIWLIRFLRPCKYYPESAYELIKGYYSFKVKHAELFDGFIPSREKEVYRQDILTVLPKRDQFGRRIVVLQLGKTWNHKKCSVDDVCKGSFLFLEAVVMEPASQIAGAVVIFDMDGMSLQQTLQFTPSNCKRLVDYLQDGVPIRIKNIHIVNQPFIFNTVFALIKPFLRQKLKSRVIFHGTDRKSLHKYLNPECLPEAYGGTLDVPRISGNQWFELLTKAEKEYEAISSYGYKKKSQK